MDLYRNAFDEYRKTHPGPKSDKAFDFWVSNGGEDRADFKLGTSKLPKP